MKIKGSFAEVLGTEGLWGWRVPVAGPPPRTVAGPASQVSTHRMPLPCPPRTVTGIGIFGISRCSLVGTGTPD